MMMMMARVITFATLLIVSLVSVAFCPPADAATEVLRPRGVPLSKKSFYDPGKDFQCLDGSATIPFMLVNDDYCDCDDGTDEPGTSACSNGLFHCSNIGYIEKIIPSSRVNDGICDCCDAGDEYSSSVNCPNNCMELGEQMREERERYLELLKAGNEIRQRYIEEAKQKLGETKQELETLRSQLTEAEEQKNAKNEVKTKAEELEKEALDKHRAEEDKLRKQREEEEQVHREAAENSYALSVFKKLDANADGVVSYDELKAFPHFDQDNNAEVSDDEAKFFLNAANQLGESEFIESSWPLVKPAWESRKPESEHPDTSQDASEPHEPAYETEEEHPGYQPNDEPEEEDESLAPAEPTPAMPDPTPVTLEYDELTAKLVEEAKNARDEYNAAEGKFLEVQTKIRELEVLLESDYGPNGEYMALKGQCFELTDNEYIYKLCPFDSASQRSKSGGSETNLGRWGKWSGPEHNRYERFLMDGGVQCWNGPVRSVTVHVSCGNENQVTRASEPNRCEYAFDFRTPAACVLSSSIPEEGAHHGGSAHTEL
ncbi:hypothetical protein TYRP_008290 [Tyrophagus putrescentiae]|nr:hypothetical protein TYRP_008290 [Tyrophagus putrescentiae]